MPRPSKDQNYLDIALKIAERSTCLRTCYASVIVKDNKIIGTGYNGSPVNEPNCIDTGICRREGLPSRTRYELCAAVHGEINAIMNSLVADAVKGSRIYIAGFDSKMFHRTGWIHRKVSESCYPCQMCWRQMKNAGIAEVCIFDKKLNPVIYPLDYFKKVDGV